MDGFIYGHTRMCQVLSSSIRGNLQKNLLYSISIQQFASLSHRLEDPLAKSAYSDVYSSKAFDNDVMKRNGHRL